MRHVSNLPSHKIQCYKTNIHLYFYIYIFNESDTTEKGSES